MTKNCTKNLWKLYKETADLVTFTKEILNGKFILCAETCYSNYRLVKKILFVSMTNSMEMFPFNRMSLYQGKCTLPNCKMLINAVDFEHAMPHSPIRPPLELTLINLMLVTSYVCTRKFYTSWHLLVQSQQWKFLNNMRDLSKVNNKDIKSTSLTTKPVNIYLF